MYRLHVGTFEIERLSVTGEAPGWVFRHRAFLVAPHQIRISRGSIATLQGHDEVHTDNADTFVLDLERLLWRRDAVPRSK